jgi:hypothetical protein
MDAKETTTTTPIHYLWEQIKMKGRPFTYTLFLEAEKIQRELIIETYNNGSMFKGSEQVNGGEQYYNEHFE